jgi:bifunctional DNase/RNase
VKRTTRAVRTASPRSRRGSRGTAAGSKAAPVMLEMQVSKLSVDPLTRLPILILKEARGETCLPIWIGLLEASAIASELEQIALERPMTHDLLKSVIAGYGGQVDSVEVTDVRDNTYFACIHLSRKGRTGKKTLSVDARPSDAIALALRCGAPIRVARQVIERGRKIDLTRLSDDATPSSRDPGPGFVVEAADPAALAEFLASLPDEDFGKWKM